MFRDCIIAFSVLSQKMTADETQQKRGVMVGFEVTCTSFSKVTAEAVTVSHPFIETKTAYYSFLSFGHFLISSHFTWIISFISLSFMDFKF